MTDKTSPDPFTSPSWPGDNDDSGSRGHGFSDSETPWDAEFTGPVVSYSKVTDESSLLTKPGEVVSGNNYGSTSARRATTNDDSIASIDINRQGRNTNRYITSNTDPGEQITLTWENIQVVLPAKSGLVRSKHKRLSSPRLILKGVSGIVRPGTLLAIMGASGSGKTTLLNVLTTRNISDLVVNGDVKANGLPIGSGMTSLSAYVQQQDLFVGVLTVKEHLWFQAMLRMDRNLSDEERLMRVEEVIRELGLSKCKNTVIGVPGRVKAISGGERKRLAFASEVLTNPPLMFCDEPTSGLDSFMAESVVQTLRGMASKGKTVLCTIHQPSSQVFALFDNLLLLAEGRVAYMGSAAGAREFFNRVGYICPQRFNPADFYIHTLAIVPGTESECRTRVDKICNNFEQSKENSQIKAAIARASTVLNNVVVSPTATDLSKVSPYKAGYARQFKHVFWRSWATNVRDKSLLKIRVLQNIFISLFAGLLYLGQPNNQKAVQNINGALFLLITNATYANAFSVINVFPGELSIFKRENENGMYRVSVYYLCKTLADVPVFILLPIIFSTVMYWMVGMKVDASAYFVCLGTAILLTQVVTSFGYLASTLGGEVSIGLAIAGPICVPLMLFGGFFLNDASIPVYFIWLEYLSWFKYGNEILVVNQWHNFGNITCEYLPPPTTSIPTFALPGNSTQPTSRCFNTGEDVIASLNYNPDNIARDFLALTALLVSFRYLGYLCLLLRAKPINLRSLFNSKSNKIAEAAALSNNNNQIKSSAPETV